MFVVCCNSYGDLRVLIVKKIPMSKAKHAKINFKPTSSRGRPKQSNETPIEFIDRDDRVVYQFLTSNERKNKATKFPHAASLHN